MKDAHSSAAEGYADLVALSLRQTMASIEITAPVVDGKLDAKDVKSFMKDVGDSGYASSSTCVAGSSHTKLVPTGESTLWERYTPRSQRLSTSTRP
jgi:Domain of unknown function (DUF4965)